MAVSYKDASVTLVKVTFGGLVSPFPQDVPIPGLKAGDIVLVVTTATGSIISGGGSNTVEGIVSQDDYLKVKGVLDDVNPYTVVLARL